VQIKLLYENVDGQELSELINWGCGGDW